MNLGPTELLIVLAIVLLLFGSAKLPKLAIAACWKSKRSTCAAAVTLVAVAVKLVLLKYKGIARKVDASASQRHLGFDRRTNSGAQLLRFDSSGPCDRLLAVSMKPRRTQCNIAHPVILRASGGWQVGRLAPAPSADPCISCGRR